jgi:hypothetical protein
MTTESRPRRLYLNNGAKYKLQMKDGTITKGIWNTDKFCWMGSLGRKRIPIELVKKVAVLDSTMTDRSREYGWFSTLHCFLDKWQPRQRDVWVHPYARHMAPPMKVTLDE